MTRRRGRPPGTSGRAAVLSAAQVRHVFRVARSRGRHAARAEAALAMSIGLGLRANTPRRTVGSSYVRGSLFGFLHGHPHNGGNAPRAEFRVVVATGIAQSIGPTGGRSENVSLWWQAGGERLTTSPLRISTAAFVGGLVLAVLCLFVTLLLTIWLSHSTGSHHADIGIGQAFTVVGLFVLCHLLAALVLTAVVGGALPASGRIAILLLAPVAFVAMFRASDLFDKPSVSPGLWALAVPAAAPTLIVAYCLWALIAPLRARVPERVAGFGLLGALGLVCAAIFPLEAMRTHGDAAVAAGIAALEAKVAAMPDDAEFVAVDSIAE